jgi:hypothetical protein
MPGSKDAPVRIGPIKFCPKRPALADASAARFFANAASQAAGSLTGSWHSGSKS